MSEFNPDLYNVRFYRRRRTKHVSRRRAMECLDDLWGPFESVLDLGAGDGICAAVLSETGAEPHMVELSETVLRYVCRRDVMRCRIHDLREPLDYGRTFDLVLCIELAEHLPESAADTLCDTVARHVGRILTFTAAPPGQKGAGHINCQPSAYWFKRFRDRALIFRADKTERLQADWKKVLGTGYQHLWRNVSVWEK